MDKGENSGRIKGVFADNMYVYRTRGVNILLQASKQPDAQTSKLPFINYLERNDESAPQCCGILFQSVGRLGNELKKAYTGLGIEIERADPATDRPSKT
jgi:hypothetical protein